MIPFLLSIALWVGGDITEKIAAAQSAAAGTSSVLLPPTAAALPEETAWQMIYAEGGVLALVLGMAVWALWRMMSRVFHESRQQNQDLMKTQVEAIAHLKDAVVRVEGAIQTSDRNNQNAIGRLSETVAATITRLDKHEQKLDAHHDSLLHHSNRLSLLESRRTPASTPVPKT